MSETSSRPVYRITDLHVNDRPLEMAELKLRAKMRDNFKCVRCGSTESVRVHHKKGTKSHSLDNLETLCLNCHKTEHGYRQT